MARGDGIHRTSARNARMKDTDIDNAQAHNEREKASYVNQDIVPERTPYNVHFKKPTAGYMEMFEQMRSDGVISTRGLKADAEKFGELIFDVNSAYFFNHGGYEFAKQFYTDAYKAAIKIVGGEQYILSAVMHADERNRAMSDALGQNVYHYHLHVIYIPVVEKQILWSKRCKDESLRGTVKETIQQVSISPELRSRFDYKGMFNLLTDEDKRKFVHFRVNQIISKYREFVSHDLPEKLHDNVVARIDVSHYKNMRDLNKKIKDTFVELIGS